MSVNPSTLAIWLYFSAVGFICGSSMGAAIGLVAAMTLSGFISFYEELKG